MTTEPGFAAKATPSDSAIRIGKRGGRWHAAAETLGAKAEKESIVTSISGQQQLI
jgi:hypothetical protein